MPSPATSDSCPDHPNGVAGGPDSGTGTGKRGVTRKVAASATVASTTTAQAQAVRLITSMRRIGTPHHG